MTHSSRLLVGTLLALASSGCTVVADLDSYISADDIGCDMEMAVRDFSPHLTDRVFFQAVTRDDAQLLRAMAIIDPLGEVLVSAAGVETVLVADVDAGVVAGVRSRFPFLQDRR